MMKQERQIAVNLGAAVAVLLTASLIATPQGPPPEGPGPGGPGFGRMRVGPGPGGDTFRFLGSEMGMHGPPVTGAPYSADAVTQITQTLADGNQISRTNKATIYRDSEGRTRREETLSAIGPWAAAGTPPQITFISDPVAGFTYILNADKKTAQKIPNRQRNQTATGTQGTKPPRPPGSNGATTTTKSLGTQSIAGVSADGTRTTTTIPAGAIGNANPIQIVSERWVSPDLQVVVVSKHTDPRMGQTVYQLSNIVRSEPAATLFQVPSDYTVTQGRPGRGRGMMRRGGPRQ